MQVFVRSKIFQLKFEIGHFRYSLRPNLTSRRMFLPSLLFCDGSFFDSIPLVFCFEMISLRCKPYTCTFYFLPLKVINQPEIWIGPTLCFAVVGKRCPICLTPQSKRSGSLLDQFFLSLEQNSFQWFCLEWFHIRSMPSMIIKILLSIPREITVGRMPQQKYTKNFA